MIDPELAYNFLNYIRRQENILSILWSGDQEYRENLIMFQGLKDIKEEIIKYFVGKKFGCFEIVTYHNLNHIKIVSKNGMITKYIALKDLKGKVLHNEWPG